MSTISRFASSVPSLDEMNGNAPGVRLASPQSHELPGYDQWLDETGRGELLPTECEDLDGYFDERERQDDAAIQAATQELMDGMRPLLEKLVQVLITL